MSELSYRAWDIVLKKTGIQKKRYPMGWMSDNEVLDTFGNCFVAKNELCQYIRDRETPVFFFSSTDKPRYSKILCERFHREKEAVIVQAERSIEQKFFLLGKEKHFSDNINWHFSEDHNRSWPLVHWSELNINSTAGYGDIKPVWELNRHQHFFTLGRAYWWTSDKRYIDEFTKQIKSWIHENPAERGINWQSNLEIALRSISWIWAVQYFKADLDNGILLDILRVLIQSGRHLYKHITYSEYCMRNNHLIGDAAGLALIAMFLPELAEAKKWKKKALGILYKEILKQVYEDGVNEEQAISYHRFVFELCFLVVRMEQINGADVSAAVLKRLEGMVDFVAWMAKADGSVPMIGDGDDGRVLLLGQQGIHDYRSMLTMGALWFNRPDFKYTGNQLPEDVLWLFGLEGLTKWEQLVERIPQHCNKTFRDGGYYILRSGWEQQSTCIMFRNGPHSSHHAHADQLHLQLSAFGEDLLIDPGTYTYNGSLAWRNYFRGTFAHNTIVVDNQSQAVPHRVFRWLDVSQPEQGNARYGKKVQWVYGGHTGYQRYKDPVTHKRGILRVFEDYVLVFDSIDASKEHAYETLFHFPQGEAIVDTATRECIFTSLRGNRLLLKRLDMLNSTVRVIVGQTEPVIQGWLSPRYGECYSAPVLSCSCTVRGSWSGLTLLHPFQETCLTPFRSKKLQEHKAAWVIEQEDHCDYVAFEKNIPLAGMKTDSSIAMFRFMREMPYYLFIEMGTQVAIEGIISIVGEWEYLELFFIVKDRRVVVNGIWSSLNWDNSSYSTSWVADIAPQ